MVCVFLWTHNEFNVAQTKEVLVTRDRDALEAHLDTLLRQEHPMAMRFEEAERYESSEDPEEDPDFDYWCDSEGNYFMMHLFPEVPVSSDGRAWVACTRWTVFGTPFPALKVTTDKRPDVTDTLTEVFEVFILGTQMSKSALKT
jgi:hypothetical protein